MTPGRRGLIAHCSSLGIESAQRPSRDDGGGPFGISWPATCLAWKPPEKGVGKAWISLDSLVRNEPYQWVTRDFRWKIFPLASSPKWRRGYAKPPKLEGEGAGPFMEPVYLDF